MIPIGQRLHTIRLQKKLSLEDVAKDIKIRQRFLSAIEKGEYDKLPSPAYAQGFITNYAEYLGVPKRETLALFRREFDEKAAYRVLPESLIKTKEFPLKRLKLHQSLLAVAGIVLIIAGYLLFQYRSVYLPPMLEVNSPQQNASITADEVLVKGRADIDATVTINNDAVSLNNKGEFSRQVSVFPGPTTLTIKARNRLGKETTINRTITVK
jgi:cytoskeletal protein RodZ